MKILFDQGTPAPLRHELAGHDVLTAFEMGWSNLSNGDLIHVAEAAFDLLVTTDKNLQHQQNLKGIRLAVLVLPTTSLPRLQQNLAQVRTAVQPIRPGELQELI